MASLHSAEVKLTRLRMAHPQEVQVQVKVQDAGGTRPRGGRSDFLIAKSTPF